jgi:hypothetical protein
MAARRNRATAAQFKGKKRRTTDFEVNLPDEAGKIKTFTVELTALGSKEYDDLIAEHPPTKEQKDQGASYNPDTFHPALISRVLTDPVLTEDDVVEIWGSEDWSSGELASLFLACNRVCANGLDVPFKSAG